MDEHRNTPSIRNTLYWILVVGWASVMIGLSLLAGLFSAPPASGPSEFLGFIVGGMVANLFMSGLLASVPLLFRRWRKKPVSPLRALSYFTVAWLLVTFIQLIGFIALLETTKTVAQAPN